MEVRINDPDLKVGGSQNKGPIVLSNQREVYLAFKGGRDYDLFSCI